MLSSDIRTDMVKEYVFRNYNLDVKNSPYGVDGAEKVHIRPVVFDELNYILHAEGTHLFCFGGKWDEQALKVFPVLNQLAEKYGVKDVCQFDFYADYENEDTNFKLDLAHQNQYDGRDKKKVIRAAEFNYLYGELVSRHLKNLEKNVRNDRRIRYLDVYEDLKTVPEIDLPYVFLFNREKGIICGIELNDCREEDIKTVLEERIFSKLELYPVSDYSIQDYMFDAFKQNERGHSFKTENCFRKEEEINIVPVSFPILSWILEQEGTYLVLFAGPWCANSQAGVTTINDFAVANNVKVYMMDQRYDSKHAIDFWMYPRSREFSNSDECLKERFFKLWEKTLTRAPILTTLGRTNPFAPVRTVTRSYTDKVGTEHTILSVDIPYLLVYDKDHKDARGLDKPVLYGLNHEGIELINCVENFVYEKANYQRYRSGVYKIMSIYKKNVGEEVKDISIDRTAPIVEGEPVRHVETVDHHKEHNWKTDDSCSLRF